MVAAGESVNWRLEAWFANLNPEQQVAFKKLHTELLKFNAQINLISKKTEKDADQVHFADSILACRIILEHDDAPVIYDIGSGNGFPGLALATLAPDRQVVMIDSDTRKIEYIKHAIAVMGLKNAKARAVRLQDVEANEIKCAISRGFASLSASILTARKAFEVGGRYYHMKGSAWGTEVADIPIQACSIWTPKLLRNYRLPDSSADLTLVLTTKIAP